MKLIQQIFFASLFLMSTASIAQQEVKKTFHEDGQVNMSQEMKDGVEHGVFVMYHKDGTIKEQGQYAQGEKVGEWKRWNEQGQQVAVANFKNGKKHGNWKIWDDEGILRYDISYADDSKVDISYMYDENGNLLSQKEH